MINTNFITGLNWPVEILLTGDNFFVSNQFDGTVGKYDATGVAKANFITGLVIPFGITVAPGKEKREDNETTND